MSDYSDSGKSVDNDCSDVDNVENTKTNTIIAGNNLENTEFLERILFAFGKNLLQLFKICHICGNLVVKTTCITKGSMVIVKTICTNDHIYT